MCFLLNIVLHSETLIYDKIYKMMNIIHKSERWDARTLTKVWGQGSPEGVKTLPVFWN